MASNVETVKDDRVAAADRRLADEKADVPPRFAGDLLAHASAEDLAAYRPDEIALCVRSAFAMLGRRKPGAARVRLVDPPLARGETDALTLVEIVNDDMPFLVDSVSNEIQDWGVEIQLLVHPIVTVRRDRGGHLAAYEGIEPPEPGSGAIRESLIQVHLRRLGPEFDRAALTRRLETTLAHVRAAVDGWMPMLERLRAAVADYRERPPALPEAEIAEAIAFLSWLADDNFTFLGMREYDFSGGPKRGRLTRADRPGLGILADPGVHVLRRGHAAVSTTPEIRDFLMRPEALIITKANLRSHVHRRAQTDYVGVKLFAPNGRLAGELRIVGLFTSTAYTRSVRSIPYIRRKVARVLDRAGFPPDSHSGKGLLNVLETYPREELFQIDEDTLLDFAGQILRLNERPRVRVLARRDRFDRFVSAIVFIPRDRFSSDVRHRIGLLLADAFDGTVTAFHPSFPESTFVRVHFIVSRTGGETPEPDQAALEAGVAAIVRNWVDGLMDVLIARHGRDRAAMLAARYLDGLSAAYRHRYPPEVAAADIDTLEALSAARPVALEFHDDRVVGDAALFLKVFNRERPVSLSVRVPMLEHMGFRVVSERTTEIRPTDAPTVFLHEMSLESASGAELDVARLKPLLTEGLVAIWTGEAESDGYNGLIAGAGFTWREAALVRAISRYAGQMQLPFSQDYLWTTLTRHVGIARSILDLFLARLDPERRSPEAAAAAAAAIEQALAGVASLDEDRILRLFANIVRAMLRTNVFQRDAAGNPRPVISFKLDPAMLDELPRPRPFREIFVYSPRVEGVHLRFGRIARGGIRWSDRPQDFRTEVLGLAKTQQVKNAVIVPVGAKGGYFPKRIGPAATREEMLAEGQATYRVFISSLLDLTDDIEGDKVAPPPATVRLDDDDPYLVVAADKGTATFSDTANAIAGEHDFWLGDAFASGGSAGYDHKKIGITAHGAHVAVSRHFREMDIDISTTPFTVAGVGDMSGDVFGNFMLLARTARLVAAFDHRDIFIDPSPDPETGHRERARLFALERSSWQDYDRRLISPGGGVFSRKDKAIPLSPEMRVLLGLSGRTATPPEVIRALLKAKVDLLWFGGIGTYVRASEESDEAVGDRANDALRVAANELEARVVGEGANLGMTQCARIEYGRAGGRCNSDAIDNSAGVNCSDVEVNIKIAFRPALLAGRLDLGARNRLLKAMTDEVAGLVLRNNYLQTLAISLAAQAGMDDFGFQLRLMRSLEARGHLDRALEALPDDTAMAEREAAKEPLTRAEIGVLLSYAKLTLFDDLLDGGVPDDPVLLPRLAGYFPERMRRRFRAEIEAHRLRREIIATELANAMINHGGPTFLIHMADRSGAEPPDIARAFVATCAAFDIEGLNRAIDALDSRVPSAIQLGLYRAVQAALHSATVWFLKNASFAEGVSPLVASFGRAVAETRRAILASPPAHLAGEFDREAARLAAAGVPDDLARGIAILPASVGALDIHLVAEKSRRSRAQAAAAYFEIGRHFQIGRLTERAEALHVTDYFDELALDLALETLSGAHRALATGVAAHRGARPFEAWLARHGGQAEEAARRLTEIAEAGTLTVSRLSVAADLLADLARSTSAG